MVPFGFERREQENQIENQVPEPQYKRVYLSVIAIRTNTGELIPQSFEWEGQTYKISQILNSQNGQSLKQNINAQRFYCRCGGMKFQLFFEDGGFGNQRFYIELKEGYSIF
ncbi:MAG TPA: hypothetical protein VIK78_01950 [Ruminiclostridium sp.]